MSKGFNKVILMGNLTRDPELRTTPSGVDVVSFTIAVNNGYKDKDGVFQDRTNFIDCVAWGGLGRSIHEWMEKGKPILVSGELESRSWEQDGQKRSKLEVKVLDFNFVGNKEREEAPFA